MKGLKAILVVGVVLVGAMSLFAPHAAQAQNLADSVDKAAHNMDFSFEPKKPGECTGDKCAAGGGYS